MKSRVFIAAVLFLWVSAARAWVVPLDADELAVVKSADADYGEVHVMEWILFGWAYAFYASCDDKEVLTLAQAGSIGNLTMPGEGDPVTVLLWVGVKSADRIIASRGCAFYRQRIRPELIREIRGIG